MIRNWGLTVARSLFGDQRVKHPLRVLQIGDSPTLREWLHHGGFVVVMATEAQEEWQAWAQEDNCELYVIDGTPDDEQALVIAQRLAPYDWVFVDGALKPRDWSIFWAMVAAGGAFIFRDTREQPILWRAIREVRGSRTMELHDLADSWGGLGAVFA